MLKNYIFRTGWVWFLIVFLEFATNLMWLQLNYEINFMFFCSKPKNFREAASWFYEINDW